MASSYRNIHPVDEILTNLVAEAVPSDNQLIADRVLENVKVPQRSGTLLLETFSQLYGRRRRPRPAARSGLISCSHRWL